MLNHSSSCPKASYKKELSHDHSPIHSPAVSHSLLDNHCYSVCANYCKKALECAILAVKAKVEAFKQDMEALLEVLRTEEADVMEECIWGHGTSDNCIWKDRVGRRPTRTAGRNVFWNLTSQ